MSSLVGACKVECMRVYILVDKNFLLHLECGEGFWEGKISSPIGSLMGVAGVGKDKTVWCAHPLSTYEILN